MLPKTNALSRWVISKAGLFSLALALVFTMGALSVSEVSNRSLLESHLRILHSQETAGQLNEIRRLLLDVETGQRGYIITGRREYLQPYEQAVNALDPALAALKTLTRDDSYQQERIGTLEALIKQRLSETGDTIAMRELAGFDAAKSVIETDAGKRTMDDARQLMNRMVEAEQAMHARRIGALQRDLATVRIAFFAIVVLDAALIALGFGLIWQDLAARRRDQQMLLEQQALLEQRVEQRTAELSELSLHLHTVREQEKAQLAREIHDEIGSTLVAAKIDISSVRERLKRIDESLSHRLTRALDAINEVIKVKRRIIEDLRPTLLDSLGIGAALRWQCQEFAARTGCRCEFSLYDEDLRLADPLSIVIYRVVQESLTNISKYAQATQVRVDITRDADELVLKIVDNGIGIDPAAKTKATSHGLIGMRERVRQVGGVIEIHGTRGQGSVISARFPLPEEIAVAS
jgi:signal transduction histidine kinase